VSWGEMGVRRETWTIVKKGEGEMKRKKSILNNQVKLFCEMFSQLDKPEIKKSLHHRSHSGSSFRHNHDHTKQTLNLHFALVNTQK
jgi:hypothetical protein